MLLVLGMGTIFENFQSIGSSDTVRDLLNIMQRYLEHHSAYLTRNVFGMPSIPGVFLTSIFSNSANMPCSDISIPPMGGMLSKTSKRGFLLSSLVKTEVKKVLKDSQWLSCL